VSSLPWPKVAVAHRSDPGRDPNKQVNEDACVYQETPFGHLLVVCDGMGGHAAGKEASTLAISVILAELAKTPTATAPGEALRQAIKAASRSVWALGALPEAGGRPGSTCVASLVHSMGTEVAHVGDSRMYLVRAGQIWQLTRDHSMVQQMVDAGLLRPEEMIGHPDSNKITRALGMDVEADVELRQDVLLQQPGDLFMLCSDGVSDVVRDSDLLAMATLSLDGARVPQLCEQVVQLANARGGPDNITIMVALVLEAGLRAQAASRGPSRTIPEGDTEPAPPVMAGAHGGALGGGELPPDTTRLNRPLNTVPGDAAPMLPHAPSPAASPHAQTARKRPDAGMTVPLAVHQATQGAAVLPGGTTGGRQATVIDDATVDTAAGEPPPETAPAAAPASRGKRVAIGTVLAVAGVVLAGLSLSSLLGEDEAPPPLVEGPSAASASPSAAPR
jgi:PPM family protein phosphatase